MSEPQKKGLMEQLVPLTHVQLEILSKLFPDRPTNEDTPVHAVYYRAGQESVLRVLRLHREKNLKHNGA